MARFHARVEGLLPRWALIEAAPHAARHPAYRDRYHRTVTRLDKQRGKKIARVEIARAAPTPKPKQPPSHKPNP